MSRERTTSTATLTTAATSTRAMRRTTSSARSPITVGPPKTLDLVIDSVTLYAQPDVGRAADPVRHHRPQRGHRRHADQVVAGAVPGPRPGRLPLCRQPGRRGPGGRGAAAGRRRHADLHPDDDLRDRGLRTRPPSTWTTAASWMNPRTNNASGPYHGRGRPEDLSRPGDRGLQGRQRRAGSRPAGRYRRRRAEPGHRPVQRAAAARRRPLSGRHSRPTAPPRSSCLTGARAWPRSTSARPRITPSRKIFDSTPVELYAAVDYGCLVSEPNEDGNAAGPALTGADRHRQA